QFYFNISRRLLNHLASKGREEARLLINEIGGSLPVSPDTLYTAEIDTNRPLKKRIYKIDPLMAEKIFALAESILGDEQIFSLVQKWVKENKLSFLVKVLDDNRSSLGDIIDAIVRFKNSQLSEQELPFSTMNAINVSLIRRFFSRRLDFINIAKTHITIDDFYDLTKRLIFTPASDGKVGGKGAGLFIAMNIIKEEQKNFPELAGIKAPKTWYIASDGVIDFINHNHLQELREYKYKELSQIRADYENIVQLFKNSSFSAEMIKGLSLALDDFGTNPLVIRSSSLLEDSFDAAFSGKYKSLFIANQGTKDERLEALIDAIAEVYASMFHHDPIEYRAERGLLDYQEEMGILIQEVVGTKVGHYLLPSFGGVAFSRNEFRWSPRIKREDNLVRIVPGLG
ncbi:MAG TPA: PEP/pyruvate-binding domain-containing protein, partial [bacterium]|nr:PEP/pyruvate-binding domain-containing protein [bacterium]